MKAKAKDWGTKLVGRNVRARGWHPLAPKDVQFCSENFGSLCGYTTDGDGNITVVMVAFSPEDRVEFAVEDVEMAK